MQLAVFRRATMTGLVVATTVVSACSDLTSPGPIDGPVAEFSKKKRKPQPPPPPPPPAPDPTPPPLPPLPPLPPSGTNPLASLLLYVNPSSNAQSTANSWRSSRPADALQMDKISAQPQA